MKTKTLKIITGISACGLALCTGFAVGYAAHQFSQMNSVPSVQKCIFVDGTYSFQYDLYNKPDYLSSLDEDSTVTLSSSLTNYDFSISDWGYISYTGYGVFDNFDVPTLEIDQDREYDLIRSDLYYYYTVNNESYRLEVRGVEHLLTDGNGERFGFYLTVKFTFNKYNEEIDRYSPEYYVAFASELYEYSKLHEGEHYLDENLSEQTYHIIDSDYYDYRERNNLL